MEGAAGMRRQGLPSVVRLRLDDRLARLRGGSINDAEHDTPTQLLPPDSLAMAEAVLRAAEVAHLHVVWTSSTLQLAKVCTQLAVPYVISPHGMLDDWCMAQGFLKKRVHLALFSRRVLTRALAVHCTAQAELDQSGVHFPKGRGVVAPLPFDASPYSGIAREREVSRGGREPGVLFLGRVNIKKGVETLLHSAALVAQKGVAFRLTVAGPGDPPEYLTKMEGLTRDLNLMGRVNFPRMVVGEEKAAVLRDAELFVLPTSQENFGYVLLEAMAAGLPVVTTRGVDIWRELEASGGAVIVDRTPEGVAEAMERLRHLPFENLGYATVDHHRAIRVGMPEVIFGKGKTPDQIAGIAAKLLERSANVLATRTRLRRMKRSARSVPRPNTSRSPGLCAFGGTARCTAKARSESSAREPRMSPWRKKPWLRPR